mgnify:CR=1 FL=1
MQHSCSLVYFINKPYFQLAPNENIPSADVLIEQCMRGDMSAYRSLYDRYNRAMFNTALRITGSRSDAEDVLQDSFIDAFTQLQSFEHRASFGAWLKQIVVFKSIRLLKKRKVRLVESEDELNDQASDDTAEEQSIEFTVASIKQAVQVLPDGYRTVLTLYLFEGYDQDEIADILQVAPSTVRSQYKRGKQKLLHLLKKENVHE